METNESIRGRSGQTVSSSSDYSAACCGAVKKLIEGEAFPRCSEHGETEWSQIPPFVQTDFGMTAIMAHWKHLESQWSHAVISQGVALGQAAFHNLDTGKAVVSPSSIPSEEGFGTHQLQPHPEILLTQLLIVPGDKNSEGLEIAAVAPPWYEILRRLQHDPEFLFKFSKFPRKFEELIAGAYERDGWDVVLTPASGDNGIDIIVARRDPVVIRMFEQVKAYAPKNRVPAKDIYALVGAIESDRNVTKGIVTTTSEFAPGIEKDSKLTQYVPNRLELRDGKKLLEWLTRAYKLTS